MTTKIGGTAKARGGARRSKPAARKATPVAGRTRSGTRRTVRSGFTGADLAEVSDNPPWTDEDIAKARPFAEALPRLAAKLRRTRGRPRLESPKVAVSIRLDAELLERLRSDGKGWQSEVNAILRKAKGLA